VLPEPYRRQKVAYPVNGFKNPSWQWLDKPEKPAALSQHRHRHHHHHKHKDIGDKKIDEGVWGFVNEDRNVLPEPWRRQKVAYPANGFKNPKWKWLDKPEAPALAQHHHKSRDIGEKEIEERVWGFASADRNVLPEPRPREKLAYPINGFENAPWQWLDKEELPASLAQSGHHHHRKQKDIGDKKIDEEVWGFVNEDKNVLPEPRRRQNIPYGANGFKNPDWQWLDKPEPAALS